MQVQVEIAESRQSRCLIEVEGRLDSNSYPQLEARFHQVNWQQTPLLILDLAALNHISSAGICCILKARRQGRAQGGRLYLVNLQEQVLKIFSILKALPAEEIFADRHQLEAYLAQAPGEQR